MALPELSLTQWLDPVFDYFARQSGIPVDQYSAVAGGQGIGTTEEVIVDLFFTGLTGKIIQFATGLVTTLGGIFGGGIPTRLRRELITWGQHSLTRVIDPKPSDYVEVRNNINSLVSGLQLGNAGSITSAFIRSPAELQAMLAAFTPGPLAIPSAPVPPAPAPTPTIPTVAPAPSIRIYA
jgi:hypothetical protein